MQTGTDEPPRKKTKARGRNATSLAERNPFSFDDRIVYDDDAHRYTVDGQVAPVSATTLINRAYEGEGFDGRVVATRCLASWQAGRGKPEYVELVQGKSDEDAISAILEKWGTTSKLGTLLHKVVEMSYNATPMSPDEYAPVAAEAETFEEFKLGCKLECVRTELSLFYANDEGNVLAAGQLDLLMKDPSGNLMIVDLKRTDKDLSPTARRGSAVPLFEALEDTPFHRYSLQNSLYSVMFERLTGTAIDKLHILQIAPGGGKAKLLQCSDLRKEARTLLENLS